jgi:hypothetical protein
MIISDISKAFDRVWHIGFLKKLESIGIQGPLLSWIKNYLSNRKQRVVINNSNYQWHDIKSGILMLSHITSAYSNRGLTNIKYIFLRVFRPNINLNFLKILILL